MFLCGSNAPLATGPRFTTKKSTSLYDKFVVMRKCLTVFSGLLLSASIMMAQPSGPLMIKGYGKDIHLDHKVAPKEGIFAIGRLYNVHPKTIAAYNKLDMSKGLVLGQVIHIPLTDTNFSQKNNKGIPIYYNVGEKETLEKVSNVNNKVSLEQLRQWNNLPNDKLTTGNKLIIGYLVNGDNAGVAVPPADKKETVGKETGKEPKTDPKNVAKTEPAKDEAKKKESKTDPAQGPAPVATRPTQTADRSPVGQGYFKTSFDEQVKTSPISRTETVTSGIFKMVDGGEEAKYYMLIN